jgi:hypothetical protein
MNSDKTGLTILMVLAAFVAVSLVSFWLARDWTFYFVLVASLAFFPCVWIVGGRGVSARARAIAGAVIAGMAFSFLLAMKGTG